MKSTLKQSLISEIFVVSTGFAALIHSSWTIGTLFNGNEPVWDHDLLSSALRYFAWVFPALLIAFALDIGQIATSHEIRQAVSQGQRPVAKYITFVVFALATYLCQWLYMAHHIPLLSLGAGVGVAYVQVATSLRDLAVWIVPAFLPLSTLLYTMSRIKEPEKEEKSCKSVVEVKPEQLLLPERSGTAKERVQDYLEIHPEAKAPKIAEELGVGVSTVYKVMKERNQ